ncbi:MAG: radical SAM protein [Bacteroidota bacterium]
MFHHPPVQYDEPLFRPPGEARSAIIQATIGCSWNKCAFCEMYTSKKFRIRPFDDLKKEIATLARHYLGRVRKIFIGDGDAFVLSAPKLLPLLSEINLQFGRIQRISAYASPRQILDKTEEELKELRKAGLKLLYIGIESGDAELLRRINKGETFETTREGIRKAHQAGIDTSVMVLNGLGGKHYSDQHARHSAELINQVNPKFLSTLTLSLPFGLNHYNNRFDGEYRQQTVVELLEELKQFIGLLEVENVIFRSDHISNTLALAGTLSKDRDKMLEQIEKVVHSTPEDVMPINSEML